VCRGVAEAHEHVVNTGTQPADEQGQVDLWNWRSEPSPEMDVGFETTARAGWTETLLERVVVWGRRLHRPGVAINIRSASITIESSGILRVPKAQVCLELAVRRLECSIGTPVAASPTLTTETVGL
jgi:hypothetical protein